jgi:DNA polymerase
MQWSILTPERSVHWDRQALLFGPGGYRSDAPAEDAKEDLWRRYYASIFNPARLKIQTMQGQMPKKYWRNLPESQLIPDLIAHAQQRTESMIDKISEPSRRRKMPVARDRKPSAGDDSSLESVRAQALHCRDCELWKNATQTVFGEGPSTAQIVLVGEQPGDQEDISGHVFVGPAGKLLNRALEEAGLERSRLYITNAVKHFKYEPRGKRRLHKKPSDREITICNQWLAKELALLKPRLIVAMGATAINGVLRRSMTIRDNRGTVLEREDGAHVIVTVHPSYLLRVRDEDREREYDLFVRDLRIAAKHAHH